MGDPFEIKKLSSENISDIFSAIGADPDWIFLISSESKRNDYADRLRDSVSYVCYSGNHFCGYIRAIVDDGMAVYISELLVKPAYRNQKIGQKLIEEVKINNSTLTVYALSDEDRYYEKKGYKKIGSVFEI